MKAEDIKRGAPVECPNCWKGIHPGQPGQCSNCGGTGQLPAPEPRVVHPEFARGMRRAVEIARKLEAELDQYDWFSVGELSEAVEKELK